MDFSCWRAHVRVMRGFFGPCAWPQPLANALERHVERRYGKIPRKDAKIMPPNTGVPTSRRASSRGAVATTSGYSPRMKAKEVIMTGRKRSRAPSIAACEQRHAPLALLLREFDDQDAVLGGQTDQHDHADLRIKIERQPAENDAAKEPSIPTETDNSTGTGIVQLSYSATRNR